MKLKIKKFSMGYNHIFLYFSQISHKNVGDLSVYKLKIIFMNV